MNGLLLVITAALLIQAPAATPADPLQEVEEGQLVIQRFLDAMARRHKLIQSLRVKISGDQHLPRGSLVQSEDQARGAVLPPKDLKSPFENEIVFAKQPMRVKKLQCYHAFSVPKMALVKTNLGHWFNGESYWMEAAGSDHYATLQEVSRSHLIIDPIELPLFWAAGLPWFEHAKFDHAPHQPTHWRYARKESDQIHSLACEVRSLLSAKLRIRDGIEPVILRQELYIGSQLNGQTNIEAWHIAELGVPVPAKWNQHVIHNGKIINQKNVTMALFELNPAVSPEVFLPSLPKDIPIFRVSDKGNEIIHSSGWLVHLPAWVITASFIVIILITASLLILFRLRLARQ